MFAAASKTASSSAPSYIEDVFSTYLYTGNGTGQTITNGVDLSTYGGLVWIKSRTDGSMYHVLTDSARGLNKILSTNVSDAQKTEQHISSFNSGGFSLANAGWVWTNSNGVNYASWTFRKQPKFFDVVTYSGDGTDNRAISHNLGSVPGCIIIKRTNDSYSWLVKHRSLANDKELYLNDTSMATGGSTVTSPTSTVFYVNNTQTQNNASGTYVAYLFANDAGGFGASGNDNVISCESFTTNGSGNATVTLGYEPQFVLCKRTDSGGDWRILDNMRGWSLTSGKTLVPNTSGAESSEFDSTYQFYPTATGFQLTNAGIGNSANFIYIAIRRGPMKTPTSGTSVYSATTYSGSGSTTVVGTLTSDLVWMQKLNGSDTDQNDFLDRLRGDGAYLKPTSTAAEATSGNFPKFSQSQVGVQLQGPYFNSSGENRCVQQFARAPSFMDVVCFTGTGTYPQIVKHNLGVQPELVIFKGRNDSTNGWWVGVKELGTYPSLYLNGNNAAGDLSYAVDFSVTNSTDVGVSNYSGTNYVMYLFASCPGVSKVGKYTGTGTTLQINCGFTGGARFVLIKRTDSTGDWYVWDTARGIISGNDPYILLNSTAAEVTNTDYIDAYSAGFEISSTAPAAINASGGTFIYLAIS